MNRSNTAQSACEGKGGFTYSYASKVANEMRRRGRKKLRAYHCDFCGNWHVGSGAPRLQDARRIDQKDDGRSGQDEDQG